MKYPDEVVAEAARAGETCLTTTAMTLCVSCYCRLRETQIVLDRNGNKQIAFYTVVINHHIRRACARCFDSDHKLQEAWMG